VPWSRRPSCWAKLPNIVVCRDEKCEGRDEHWDGELSTGMREDIYGQAPHRHTRTAWCDAALSVPDLQRHLPASAIDQRALSASDGLQTAWAGNWHMTCVQARLGRPYVVNRYGGRHRSARTVVALHGSSRRCLAGWASTRQPNDSDQVAPYQARRGFRGLEITRLRGLPSIRIACGDDGFRAILR
jgi:hypothetical protein